VDRPRRRSCSCWGPTALSLYAKHRLDHRYEAYQRHPNRNLARGLETARLLLDSLGLVHVRVERAPGRLSDHYDPHSQTLRLSTETANGRSIAASGVVAHEVGHAHQDAAGYPLLELQQRLAVDLAPIARASGWLLLGGVLFGFLPLVVLAGVDIGSALLVGVLSIPLERDASRRAVHLLRESGLADEINLAGVKDVLDAAAFTYLAGVAHRAATFLLFVGLVHWLGLQV
jgi:Zn-dependent membrane protease YugP